MNSKINGVSPGPTRLDSSQPAGTPQSASRPGQKPSAGATDEVSLTGSAQVLVKLEKALDAIPVIDRERVESVKQAIADGKYAVDAERVAAEVLRMEQDLEPK